MGVLIKGMQKPKLCEWVESKVHNFEVHRCPLLDGEDNCRLQDCKEFEYWEEQYTGCPLEEVDDTKYKCDLWLSGEERTSGTMMLTKSEYELIKRVSNEANWDNLCAGMWSGSFGIYCEELEGKKG